MKAYYLNILILFCTTTCFAQDKEVNIQGIITDENNLPIPDVVIRVNWGKMGVLSREDGSFRITTNSQDTLIFEHTSFEPKAIVASYLATNNTIKIQLTERTLTLGEVEINNWGTWQDFKHKIESMNADSIRQTDKYRLETMFGNKKRHPIKNPYFRGQEEPKINPLTVIGGIFSGNIPQILYNKYSRKEKNRRKIQAEKLQELAVEHNKYRYSKEILHKMLKIKGKELQHFKAYCDYSLDFRQNDYKIVRQIKMLYQNWKQKEDNLIKNTTLKKNQNSSQSSSTLSTK